MSPTPNPDPDKGVEIDTGDDREEINLDPNREIKEEDPDKSG